MENSTDIPRNEIQRSLRVLVVDDDASTLQLLDDMLTSKGFTVACAKNGQVALAMLEPYQPDLLLVDARMPVVDGFAVCKFIRSQPHLRALPILMITAFQEDALVEHAFAVGADDVVFKPFHTTLLVARVRRLIEAAESARAYRVVAARFQSAFDQAGVGAALIRFDGIIMRVNRALCTLLGYATEEITGKHFISLTHPDDIGIDAREEEEFQQGIRDSLELEKRFVRKDSSVGWCLLHIVIVEDEQNSMRYSVCQVQDITARKQADQATERLNEQLVHTLESITDCFFALDHEWRFTYINAGTERLWKCSRAEVIGKDMWAVFPKVIGTVFAKHYREALASQQAVSFTAYYEPLDGWFETHVYPTPEGLSVYFRDVTQQLQATQMLQEREATLSAMFASTLDAIVILNTESYFVDMNPAACALVGLSREQFIGRRMLEFSIPERHSIVQNDWLVFLRDGMLSGTFQLQCPNGEVRQLEFNARANFLPGLHLSVLRDVTERRNAEQKLAHTAFHDALTGLPNRVLFMDRLSQAVERAARDPLRGCAVLFLDLDRFKTINDSFGHFTGDRLLIEASRRLERCIRPGDTVARFGGDEFALLLEDLAIAPAVTAIAERITAAFHGSFLVNGHDIVTSASIGIVLQTVGARPEELLRDADIAMYQAKRQKHGRYVIADPQMHAHIRARLELEADLRHALERGEFMLHYQPKMTVDGRVMQGAEALLRWRHPKLGFVSPLEFISLAEETGLIIPIGEWALRTACTQLRAWRESDLPPFFVSVNLSSVQFKQPGIAGFIHRVLEETGLSADLLGLELTESMLMEDAEATIAALWELRDIGIHTLAIDDFGTGYSSLSYLQRFPVTEVKIDRSFVHNIIDNTSHAAIAMATIALARSLGLKTIAEGVETEEQRVFLERAGCDRLQGYLFSGPLLAEQLPHFVRSLPTNIQVEQ